MEPKTTIYKPNPSAAVTKASDFKPMINSPFVVKNLYKPGEVAMLAGAPGLGKSTITASIAAHAAQGRNFGGLSVKNALVVYYAAEDAYGVLCRAYPYMRDPTCSNAPFYVVHGAPNLLDPEMPEKISRFVAAKMAEHGCETAFVIFDTLNRCIGEADENSSTAMGTVIGNAGYIAQTVNASVLFVHHTGNNSPDRPRGSSAFHGNVDTLCLLSKPADAQSSDVVLLNPVKQKNAQGLGPLPFKLDSLKIGDDDEGCAVTVPKAVPMEPSMFTKTTTAANDNRRPKTQTDERRADIRRVLSELSKSHPQQFFKAMEIADRTGSIFNDIRNSDSLRKAVTRALNALVEADIAEAEGTGYRLRRDDGSDDHTADFPS